jgi:prolyl-tRNA synthetase
MGYTFTAEDGTEQHATMGCYGIGVTRVAASAVEQHHDDWGIIWPDAIAPYKLIIVIANTNDPTQATLGEALYSTLSRLFPDEVLLDDRDERAGVKFKDADLMGFPLRITVGKFASEGKVEVKRRGEKDAQQVIVESLADALKTFGF